MNYFQTIIPQDAVSTFHDRFPAYAESTSAGHRFYSLEPSGKHNFSISHVES